METRKLKNIAIVILLLLNAFLLALLGYQKLQAVRVSRAAMEELTELFAAEELALSPEIDAQSLAPLTLARQSETERRIASFLLGETVSAEDQGGGIYSYRSERGTVQFRAGGGFDTVHISREIGDVTAFVHRFCNRFDYEELTSELENGSGTVTAMQYVAGVPIFECSLTMVFQNGYLVHAAGAHIDLTDAAVDGEEYLSLISALVHFMDYRRATGIVCSEVRAVRCVYRLESSSTPPQLLPVWEIETDTYTYLVDGITAAVERK